MVHKVFPIIVVGLLSVGNPFRQQKNVKPDYRDPYYKYYVGTTAFMFGNLFPVPPSLYQLNFRYTFLFFRVLTHRKKWKK